MSETKLRHTAAPPGRLESSRPRNRSWHPLDLFVKPALAARWWFMVAVASLGLNAVQPYLLVKAYRTQERVVIMDEGGTFHVSPLLGFEEAGKLHEQHALLACLALFQLNPHGFDQPELLEKLFLADALALAKQEWATASDEFEQKNLHQKVEVQKLTVLETEADQVLVEAVGQLVRTGRIGQLPFTEAPTFTAQFTFARNPNLTTNGRYPLAVWHYELSF
jgi:hypothetical protein